VCVYIIVKKRVKLDCWLINRWPWYWFTIYILVYIVVPSPEVQTGVEWPGNEVVIIPGCISPALLQCTAVLGQAAWQTFGRSRNLSVCWGKNHKWQYSELHDGFQPSLKCASPTSPHNTRWAVLVLFIHVCLHISPLLNKHAWLISADWRCTREMLQHYGVSLNINGKHSLLWHNKFFTKLAAGDYSLCLHTWSANQVVMVAIFGTNIVECNLKEWHIFT